MNELVYLASPYSHPNESVRAWRYQVAAAAAAELMQQGVAVFSPIAHTHPIALYGLPKGWDFWEQYDRLMLNACSRMMVLLLNGWEESKGVQAEMDIMREQGKPIAYLDPLGAIEAVRRLTGE